MDEKKTMAGHLRDLADRSYNNGIYTFSNFLDEAAQTVLKSMIKELSYAGVDTFGGRDFSDRVIARFGNETLTGYTEEYPISCLCISPVSRKFSEPLTHRDFLGSLMGLGIERELIGDIIVRDDEAYVFCLDRIAGFIIEQLSQVRHTLVHVTQAQELPENAAVQFREATIIASSPRLDALVSKVFNLSRAQSQKLFSEGKIFVNGAQIPGSSFCPDEGDRISVRGYGKFLYAGELGVTGKGRLRLLIKLFV